MPLKVEYVDKSAIYPRFGLWRRNGDSVLIQIRKDLPVAMQEFLLDHEVGHELDKQAGDFDRDHWTENEIEANWYALPQHPWGAFLTVLWSLAPYRLKYYWFRFKAGGNSGECP